MLRKTRRIAIAVFSDRAGVNETLEQLRRVGVREPAILTNQSAPLCASGFPSRDLSALASLLPGTLVSALAERIAVGSIAVYAEIGGRATEKAVAEVLLASHADAVQLHDCLLNS
ncbi:hypothetical protein [Devosia submarina]|uniref:hypothetical protein n=1 Tax=Devosia submarina TaxID=1173082 RepID=UPI000D3B6A92|nr:hypothetical protein [Devosia submarina]